MKKLTVLLTAVVLIFTSCNSSKKNLIKGNYDEIISKSVKKLIKNPDNNDDAILLDKAFSLANERDLDAIKFLKLDGQPETWDKIMRHYEILNNRQKRIKTVLPFKLNGQLVNYRQVDYDAEIVAAKRNAAAFFYNNGKRLLESNDKLLIRQAHAELLRAKYYGGSSYLDIDNLISEAEFRGINRVFVKVENTSSFNFPPEFMNEIVSGNTRQMNTDWVHYFFNLNNDKIEFDYYAIIKIMNVQVSPDDLKTKDRVFNKNIEDGFEYVLDANGNVRRDSLGNDMKKTKYKALQCALIETIQHKEARLDGEIEFIELYPMERMVNQKPFGAETVFHHVSARAIGDVRALDNDAKKALESEQIPFPSDQELVFNNAVQVQEAIQRILGSNQGIYR